MILDQSIIRKALSNTYLIDICRASNNYPNISDITIKLIETVTEIYQYFEPDHFNGELVVFLSLDSSIISTSIPERIFLNNNLLTILQAKTVLIQNVNNELLLWKNENIESILKNKNILFYHYKNKNEYFCINNKKIVINSLIGKHSIFSIYYSLLEEALKNYSQENILNTSCEHFKLAWYDEKHIYFKNKPEKIMHKSLKEYLKSTLRGVEVIHEFNLNSKEPVDIRVQWGIANRSAHIEIKWLGVSIANKKAKTLTIYSKARAITGVKQIKRYLDLASKDSPSIITKGYLVIIDGRRKGTNKKKLIKIISEKDGLFYQHDEIIYPEKYNYSKTIANFEPPLRMFARPICQ